MTVASGSRLDKGLRVRGRGGEKENGSEVARVAGKERDEKQKKETALEKREDAPGFSVGQCLQYCEGT